jgi:hypothetical protein
MMLWVCLIGWHVTRARFGWLKLLGLCSCLLAFVADVQVFELLRYGHGSRSVIRRLGIFRGESLP